MTKARYILLPLLIVAASACNTPTGVEAASKERGTPAQFSQTCHSARDADNIVSLKVSGEDVGAAKQLDGLVDALVEDTLRGADEKTAKENESYVRESISSALGTNPIGVDLGDSFVVAAPDLTISASKSSQVYLFSIAADGFYSHALETIGMRVDKPVFVALESLTVNQPSELTWGPGCWATVNAQELQTALGDAESVNALLSDLDSGSGFKAVQDLVDKAGTTGVEADFQSWRETAPSFRSFSDVAVPPEVSAALVTTAFYTGVTDFGPMGSYLCIRSEVAVVGCLDASASGEGVPEQAEQMAGTDIQSSGDAVESELIKKNGRLVVFPALPGLVYEVVALVYQPTTDDERLWDSGLLKSLDSLTPSANPARVNDSAPPLPSVTFDRQTFAQALERSGSK